MHILIAFAALAALVGVALVLRLWGQRAARGRDEHMRRWAAESGFTFAQSDPSLDRPWPVLPFTAGVEPHAVRVVRGHHAGLDVVAFDFGFHVPSGGGGPGPAWNTTGGRTHFAVCATRVSGDHPQVALRAAVHGHQAGSGIEGDGAALELDPRFRVTTADAQLARAFLTPSVLDRVHDERLDGLLLAGPDLVLWRANTGNRPAAMNGTIDALHAFVTALPGAAP